jgi:uncharacterized protein YuzE
MTDPALRITYSETGGALYLALGVGEVAETVEIEELVYVDVDAAGRPVGIEFAAAEDLVPFLVRRGGEFVVPARMVGDVERDLQPA